MSEPMHYMTLEEIPWFQPVLAQARKDLAATPVEYQPTWYRRTHID